MPRGKLNRREEKQLMIRRRSEYCQRLDTSNDVSEKLERISLERWWVGGVRE